MKKKRKGKRKNFIINRWKQFISKSLRRQLVVGGFLSLAISIGVMFVVYVGAETVLDRTVYGTYYMNYVATRELNNLQDYINKKEIGIDDPTEISNWCYDRFNREMLFIYAGNNLVYEMSFYQDTIIDSVSELEAYLDEDVWMDEAVGQRIITFPGDSTEYTAYLCFIPSNAFYVLAILLAGVLGFVAFAVTFVFLVRNKLKYIMQLKSELDVLAGGDLNFVVTERGSDEIGNLAVGINEMRKSILKRQIAEEKARQANAELVTAMSHDLRSPLTAMIGYLEILKRHGYDSIEQQDYFVDSSLKKALQIKSMSDKLFEYFLVSQSETEDIQMEEYDIMMLIPELLEEYVFMLETEGFEVRSTVEELQGTMIANPELLKRVFDNLYSNLKKYADPGRPIDVFCDVKGQTLNLILSNTILPQASHRESTQIGLKTCEKILTYHNGTFSCHHEDGEESIFVTELELPVIF